MDDDGGFDAWFGPWKETRPDMMPLGWYCKPDLKAAFSAGQEAERQRVIVEVLGPERAEELLRAIHKKD